MHYRNKWYVLREEVPMMFCVGVNGQNLFVDCENEIVIAKLSSQAAAMDKGRISLTMQLIAAILKLSRLLVAAVDEPALVMTAQ